MARQDLAYQITVNDAQLRLATQHVAAFNAEMTASTVTGRKVDESLRSVGRRASQVGNFFIRNVTIPVGVAAYATGKMAAGFETALAKISGITQTTAADTQRLGDAALRLSSRVIVSSPNDLVDAMFELQSVGFKTNQTIASMPPIAKAAAAGLGSIRDVADFAASAMDAYGIAGQNAGPNVLSAAQATAVLIGTVNAGKLHTDELARSMGRVIPLANAMGLSIDQVGAAIASMSRQGLNANLAVTGTRALLSQIARAQPTTQKAFATVGTSAGAVQKAIANPKIGLLPTLIALREEFDKLGPVKFDAKTLKEAGNGQAEALLKIRAAVGTGNEALSKAFPNIRALTAFLILTGKRRDQNANIFAQLKHDVENSQETIKRAYQAKLRTPIGQLQLQLSKLRTEAIQVGPTFIKAATGFLGFANGVTDLFHSLGPFKGVLKNIGIGLALFGPIVALFGRATQAASFGVTMWGRWQTAALKAAYATRGINVEEDRLLVAQRRATVVFDEGQAQMTAAANRTAAAVANIGRVARGSAVAAASGGSVFFSKVSKGTSRATRDAAMIAPGFGGAATGGAALAVIQRRATLQVAAATDVLTVAQMKYDAALSAAIPNQIRYAKAELDAAASGLRLAETNANLLFPADVKLLELTRQLTLAQRELTIAQQQGVGIAMTAARVASLEAAIIARKGMLAATPATGFAALDQRAKVVQATKAAADAEARAASNAARITGTSWGAALTGMKDASRFAFGLIGLTFATEVASKIIFSSHETKTAVTHDLFDIHKALTGTLAGLGLLGVALAPKLRVAAGALRGGTGLGGALEAVGIGALSTRTKIGLLLASVVGLQASGFKMETIFNVALGGMAIKALATSRAMQTLAASTALGGLGGRAAGLLAIFGRLPVVLTATALAMSVLDKKSRVFGGGGERSGLSNFFHDINASSGKQGPLGSALRKTLGAFGIEFAGGFDKAKKKIDGSLNGVDDELFRQLAAGLPKGVIASAKELRRAGKEYAAEQLLAQARTKQQVKDVKEAVAFLHAHGHDAVANLLSPIAGKIKEAKHQFDDLFGNIGDSITGAFDARTDRILDIFDRKASDVLRDFDDRSKVLEDKLKVTVKTKSGTFTIKVNGKTPAERELEALDKVQQKRNFQRDIFDSRRDLSTAFLTGDPTAIRDAQRKLEDAKAEQSRFGLQKRGVVERKAADSAIESAKKRFERERELERRVVEDRQAALRRDVAAERAVARQQIDTALKAELKMFQNGKIGLGRYFTDVKKIMQGHNITLAQAGRDGGKAYADQMQAEFAKLERAIRTSLTKITKQAQGTADKLAEIGGIIGILSKANKHGLLGADIFTPGSPSAKAFEHAQTVAGNIKAKEGVPTRPALLNAISQLGVPLGERARLLGLVPESGRPTQAQVHQFLSKLSAGEQGEMKVLLKRAGFSRFGRGGIAPGHGYGDTVPAMLTPGEVVLNKGHQDALASMLGVGGLGPRGLFELIRSKGAHFAEGGVVGSPTIPGFGALAGVIRKLVESLQRSALVQENLLRKKASVLDTIFSGTAADPGGHNARARRLRQQLDPVNIVGRVNNTPGLADLPRDQKIALEARLSRLQAHPVLGGLFTPSATGAHAGGHATLQQPHELAPGVGGGGFTITGGITVHVEGVHDPAAADRTGRLVADATRRHLQARGGRNTPLRRSGFGAAALR